jgi:hypothetical protein
MCADSISKVSFYDTGTDFPEGANYDFNATNIQKELSKGYTFVNEDSHGNYSFWETEGPNYTVSHAETLNNSIILLLLLQHVKPMVLTRTRNV